MKNFGYGYIKDKAELVPYNPVCFYAFRMMVGVGSLLLLFFVVVLFIVYKKDISRMRWMHWAAIAMLPLTYICSECGWLVAEFGRQPWTIQDMLPTCASVSNIGSSSVALTFFIFLALFTTLLFVEIKLMLREIRNHEAENEQA